MLELRLLNGLHRGATLPLDAQAVNIGADDTADVVMADHGIAAGHALLSPHGAGWLLSATGGAIYAADLARPQQVVELDVGGHARVGDIWLCIAHQGAPWQAPPPLPEPEAEFDPRAAAGDEAAANDADGPPAAPPPPAKRRGRWRRRGGGAILAAVVAMLAATAYALTSRPPPPEPPARGAMTAELPATPGMGGPAPAVSASASASAASASSAATSANTPELAALFRKRLADAELLNRVDLTLEPHGWTMRAHLDDEETARFERILNGFIKEHHITFPVSAKAVTAEAMLPFRIGQVISGANAGVVTQDGARLYIGDDYRGVRLVAIQPNRVTFFGKRKIEVIW